MDRLDELAVWVAIVEAGSLAAAGRRLRHSPPAVTRALAALESRAGTLLLQRTTRRAAPTEAGRRLAEHARRVLAEFDEAMRAGSEESAAPTGVLRMTAPLVFGRLHVMPLVSDFLDAHPGVRVELSLSDRTVDLIEDGLDVAVRIGRLPDSGLVARRVGQVKRVLVASPAYLTARGMPRDPAGLEGHDIIYTAGRAGPIEWRFRHGGRDRATRLSPRLSVNQVDAALFAARQGRGVASALSYQVADDLAAGRLVRLLAAYELPALPVQLVVPSTRLLPARVRLFLDHAAHGLARLAVLGEP